MQQLDLLRRFPQTLVHLVRWVSATRVARQPAQGLVEYGLILVLIMVVCVGVVGTIGQTLNDIWYQKLLSGDSPFAP